MKFDKQFIKSWVLPPSIFSSLVSGRNKLKQGFLSADNKKLLKKSAQLQDRHIGSRCFILGAGSSIAKQDLKKLAGEFVISVSNTFVHPDFSVIRPKYHVLPHILQGHGTVYPQENFVVWLKEMEQQTLEAEMFFHIGDRDMIESNGLFKGRVIHWNEYASSWNGNFSCPIDLSKVPAIGSVSEYAITVALYLGFDKIYLLGFDHDWFNGPLVYFYDHKTQHAMKPTAEKLEFADAEFQMRRHADIFRKYKYLYAVKENIFNANSDPKHYLDVFPRVNYESLFHKC